MIGKEAAEKQVEELYLADILEQRMLLTLNFLTVQLGLNLMIYLKVFLVIQEWDHLLLL
jgi:hypothetical protein